MPIPLTADDFISFDPKQAAIGQLLFYDPILSGNKNIACATCHHPKFGTGDGLSLGVGEGGFGLGPDRTTGTGSSRIRKRIPRNAPGLWNLGAKSIHTMFHDGRLSVSDRYENGFDSPAEEWLPSGFNSLLAAQAIFPLVAQFEMAGNPSENEVAGAVHDRIDAAWPIIAKRVRTIPAYGAAFIDAFQLVETSDDVTIVEIANALAAFMGTEWQSFDAPYDAYIAGETAALNLTEKAGMNLFNGKGNCASCHSGNLFSDQQFHALALPAFGPGRTRRFDPIPRDVGRMGKSDLQADAYRFRTPMLRNVALTAPYGHNGAYPTLEGIIRHHVETVPQWSHDMLKLPKAPWIEHVDFAIQDNPRETIRLMRHRDTSPVDLSTSELDQLVAFLGSLTGTTIDTTPFGIPPSVPSGLPLDTLGKK